MSRIIKMIKILCCPLFGVIALVCALARLYILALIFLLAALIWGLNLILLYQRKKELAPFGVYSHIRNVDFLLIGDICKADAIVPEGKTFIQLAVPDCGLLSCYELLRHTFSILKEEGGTVVIITRPKNENRHYSVFDIPYFNDITVKRLHLEELKQKSPFPVIFSPIGSVKKLLNSSQGILQDTNCKMPEIGQFCDERNITLCCKELI